MLLVCVVSYFTTYHLESISRLEVWILALLSVCLVMFSGCIIMVCRQPQTTTKVSFMVRGAHSHALWIHFVTHDKLFVYLFIPMTS